MSGLLKAFEAAKTHCEGAFYLTGDTLIVEKVAKPEYKKETTGPDGKKATIFLATGSEKKIDGLDMNLPMFVRVLAVGPGFYELKEGDLKEVSCEVEPGDIILIGRMSVNWFSVFGNLVSTTDAEIGLTRESEVKMRFKGQGGYDKYFEALNHKLSTDATKEKTL